MQYELGQIVEVVDNTCGHSFYIGQKVIIKKFDDDNKVEAAWNLDKTDFWYLDEDDIAPWKGELQ
jgi:hypothetical protein